MADTEITPEAAEGYLAAVADHLEAKGYSLSNGTYTFDGDEVLGGAITLLNALPDGEHLRLIWTEQDGWSAGYPSETGGTDCLTELLLDLAPDLREVASAVRAIVRSGRLESGVSEDAPAAGPDHLATYEPRAAELVQAAADVYAAQAARLQGRQARPAPPDGVLVSHVRPIVATVWHRVREDLAEVERLRADAKHWHDTYQQAMNANDEFLGYLLDLLPGATETGMDAGDQIPRAIEALRAERDRLRIAWESARQGRRSARILVRELLGNLRKERVRAARQDTDLTARLHHAQSEAAELRRRLEDVRRTVAELHDFNSPEGDHVDGCPGCRLEHEIGEPTP
ncbi:DUF6292 family protein [Spirillospora sp. NBC_01491]|uniref:DUF6292 family protein n=1 Tax=Spirillospora sp. NBC_01491 TaxID=2976007 RepID=UPI002E35D0CC|nr:DUF6292 family protein [Spirillospora sp. NBC_01491]